MTTGAEATGRPGVSIGDAMSDSELGVSPAKGERCKSCCCCEEEVREKARLG